MAHTHLTAARLAAHFNVTVPAMRKALIAKELLDEYLNAPTIEGHLIGGAKFVERIGPDYQAFPVWPIDKIAELLPEISNGAEDREYSSFRNRWKAIDAVCEAGHLLYDEFNDDDPDIGWLCFEPVDLLCSDTSKAKRDYAINSLAPRIERVESKIKKQRRGKKPNAIKALRILHGVHGWAMGESFQPNIEDIQPIPFIAEPVERAFSHNAFTITEQEKVLLETGFVFIKDFADSPQDNFQQLAVQIMLKGRGDIKLGDTFIRMITREDRHIMLLVFIDRASSASPSWGFNAWEVSLNEELRLAFEEEADIELYRPEFTFVMPRTGGDHKKSRFWKRHLVRMAELRAEIAKTRQRTAEVLEEAAAKMAAGDLMLAVRTRTMSSSAIH